MASHKYKIIINKDPNNNGSKYEYKYMHTSNISILVNQQAAKIEFVLSVKKDFEYIISFQLRLFKDSLRKIHLLHALKYDSGLNINRIYVNIDGEEKSYTANDSNFPYFISMISKQKLHISQFWDKLDLNETILSVTKTKADKDYRFASLFSYLSSLDRKYEIDRFTCLWTSMNAFYNYVATCFGNKIVGKDKESLELLLRLINCGNEFPSRNKRQETSSLHYQIGDSFEKITNEKLDEIYSLIEYNKECMHISFKDSKFNKINELAEKLAITPYGLLLLEYPYYWRCKYLHGNRPTILFCTYNDRDVSNLRVMNLFLDAFLKREIPKMFSNEFYKENFARIQNQKD